MTLKLSLLFAAATVTLVCGERTANEPVKTTLDAKITTGATIRIDHSRGSLSVEGWDGRDVEVVAVESSYQRKKPLKDTVLVTSETQPNGDLSISTNRPKRRGVSTDYQIRAPRNAKLVIHHGVGSVFISDMNGDVDVTCGRGDIVLMLRGNQEPAVDARSKFGTVISDFEGRTHLNFYRLGERLSEPTSKAARTLRLRVRFGGITIKAVPEEAYGVR